MLNSHIVALRKLLIEAFERALVTVFELFSSLCCL